MRGDERSRRERLIIALVAGSTIATAATEANISEATAYRWLSEPETRHRLAELRGQLLERTLDRLGAIAHAATTRLARILADDNAPASVHVRAALGTLGTFVSYRDAVFTERRLLELERRIGIADSSDDLIAELDSYLAGERT